MTDPILILASSSPRRRAMMAWMGRSFEALTPNVLRSLQIDETPCPGEEPAVYVQRLAKDKAGAAIPLIPEGAVVLAADTTVAIDGFILGKPADRTVARAMLVRLRGRIHHVYTALALLDPRRPALLTDLCDSPVPMRDYGDDEIDSYVASGDPLDKAGAYAIQHPGFNPVDRFSHCFASVMGLPLCHLERALRGLGFKPNPEVPRRCQFELSYHCPVFKSILSPESLPGNAKATGNIGL